MELGVCKEASFKPSIINSSIISCQNIGMFMLSDGIKKENISGIYEGYFKAKSHKGVINKVVRLIRYLERRRYVPVIGGK